MNGHTSIIGARLREARTFRGLTLRQVATQLGVGHQNVSAWELGSWEPLLRHVVALVQLYDVPADWLLGRRDGSLSKDESQLIDIYQGLSGKQRKAVLDLAKVFKD